MYTHTTGTPILSTDQGTHFQAIKPIIHDEIFEELAGFLGTSEDSKTQSNFQEEKRKYNGRELHEMSVEGPQCLLEPLFPRVGLASLVGSSDTGKSMLLRQLGLAIVAKRADFLGFLLHPIHHRVLMVLTEDGPIEIKELLSKQAADISAENLENIQFIFSPDNALQETESELINNPVDVVIVDAWGDVSGVDTKDNGKVRIVLNEWQKLAIKYQCLIIFLHHTGKTTDNKAPSKHNTIGAQSFEAKVRCLVELRKDIYDKDTRHFCIVKGNSLPQSFKTESFVLDFNSKTFLFRFTGARKDFDELTVPEFKPREDNHQTKFEAAKILKDQGKTMEEIAPMIGYSNKGAVSKLFTKAAEKGWQVS